MNTLVRVVVLFSLLVPTCCLAAEIQLLPAKVVLTGNEARQRLLVEHVTGGRHMGQVEGELTWMISDPAVVKVENSSLIPLADGTATITVTSAKSSATSQVTVEHFGRQQQWSFRNHVQAVLARVGCNSGSCHGALAGKGGFRLSLRGYNSDADYFTIAKQARGRRVELSDPGRSLVLAKPSGGLPHKGGLRFETDSRNYRVLSEWIAAGAEPPADDDPVVESIEILPDDVQLSVGQTQDIIVRAHYSDGHTEDVTQWVQFSSADETVARVDEHGRVTVIGHGAGAVSAWFASRIVLSRVTSPYLYDVPAEVYASEPRRNFIDDMVLAKLKDLRLRPSAACTDEQFIRRTLLDTIGTLPTAAEVREFLADETDGKRDRLIESLLARPEFVDYWTYKWSDVLTISGNRLRPKGVEAYYKWVRNEVAQNTPWDELARKIVTSTGSSVENGATNFYALHQDPENMAENVSKAFLGLSIACAKCHNHPLEKWTNDQYYGFANLFSRVRAKGWGGDYRSGDGIRTLYVVPTGELSQPRTGKPQPPTPLDGEPLAYEATTDRRIHVAAWLTSPENPYFTRAITNRVWQNFFGVGLVEEVDDLRRSNPASNEELLAAAASHLIQRDYDLKALMRTILQSHTYQRSSLPLEENRDEQRFYSRYYPRRLMAEVMLDAFSQATDVPTAFTHIAFPGGDRQETKLYAKGTRAIQLYDSAVESYFLSTFGRNAREITCECERSDEPSMVQVLHIANGKTINDKLKAEDNRISKLLKTDLSPSGLIDETFLVCLSRLPNEKEKTGLLEQFAELPEGDAEQKRLLLEDMFWAVLSTREFLFNH
jgi:hypothetical protein